MKEKRQLKYPQFADWMFAAMMEINSRMEEFISMMKTMKEGEGFIEIDDALMVRFLNNFKEILDLENRDGKE